MALANQQTDLAVATGSSACSAAIMERITYFESRLTGVLDYGSFEFSGAGFMESTATGRPQPHRCSYELRIDTAVSLGEISVSRKTPFRESELQVLEALLAQLCLQLRDISCPPD